MAIDLIDNRRDMNESSVRSVLAHKPASAHRPRQALSPLMTPDQATGALGDYEPALATHFLDLLGAKHGFRIQSPTDDTPTNPRRNNKKTQL